VLELLEKIVVDELGLLRTLLEVELLGPEVLLPLRDSELDFDLDTEVEGEEFELEELESNGARASRPAV